MPTVAIPRGSLVVSCQARPDNPLHGPVFMAAMAQAAAQGGASAIRANGPADIAAIRAAVDLPIIGILKRTDPGFPVSITPDFASARAVVEAGADIVALDATDRSRNGERIEMLIPRIREELGCAVMADIATLEQGLSAARLGAAYVATTLAGYTGDAPPPEGPDLDLVRALARALVRRDAWVVAEGRYSTAAQIRDAFACGAGAVVVGTAITNPREITRKLAAAAPWKP
ncbi:MAG TPA: N-acetylmannosamine-6-phosphate 2-epimerase [Acetobacteraceae bacterium]|jgi:putative N-acetylmannosamine-6-phosphate epimerase|nr:N-acetylmannosamine-6-phosphate 2-epimerase [Acetobacteraceae bacterium]